MTGWGQEGPWSSRAGHDINYLSLAGPLAHIGRHDQPPTPPLNLVADFGGGGMLLAIGVCAVLVERATSGIGQVIDAAMVDGVALLAAPIANAYIQGFFNPERGTNWLDSGAHYYDVYETEDGQYLSIGAIEPKFYANLLDAVGLDAAELPDQNDVEQWPAMKQRFAEIFRGAPRSEWESRLADLDVCFAPVLSFGDAFAPSASRGAWHVRRRRWDPAAGTRTSLRSHGADARSPTRTSRPSHRRDLG